MSLAAFQPYVPGTCTNELPFIDLFQAGDIVVAVLGYVIMGINALQIAYIWRNRKFQPIAAKQPLLLLLQFIGGVCWVTGNYFVNDTFPVDNQTYGVYCVMRRFWLSYLFGFCFWISCMIVRFIRLYVVVIQVKVPRPLPLYFTCLLFPVFVICVVALFVDSDRSCDYIVGTGEDQFHFVRCKLNFAFGVITVVIHIAYFLINCFFIYTLRNIRKSFNEYKELRFQILVGIVLYAALVGLSLGGADVYVAGRSVMSLLYVGIVTAVQNLALGKLTYDCIFHREQCLQKFKEQLSMDSKSHMKNFSTTGKGDKKATVSDSHVSKNSVDETTMKGEENDRAARVHTVSSSNQLDTSSSGNSPVEETRMVQMNSSQSSLPPV